MQYKNTQIGTVSLGIMAAVFLLIFYASMSKPNEPVGFAYAIIGVVSVLFSSLTIKIKDSKIHWFFGPKFWHKSLELSQIESAKVITTKWYYGFGVRLISTGWLYNVSGLTAVELKLKDGTTVSLGTNDPDNLLSAIEQGYNAAQA